MQFGPEFGDRALEGTILDVGRAQIRYAMMGIVQLKLSEMLGKKGGKFRNWALRNWALCNWALCNWALCNRATNRGTSED